MKAYLEAIILANRESFKEAYEMSEDKVGLDQIFEDIGLAAKWEARGEAKILGLGGDAESMMR